MKAIETEYTGCRFRSRTEARHAAWFDALGIQWAYEPEGFDLGDGDRYLPDFRLPDAGWWVEVKGQPPTEDEFLKATKLMIGTGEPVVISWGFFDGWQDSVTIWKDKNDCIQSERGRSWIDGQELYIRAANQKARSARFGT